ncbi:DUF3613 domain-containing protein [Paraburkholderia sp. DHOC27]|nr:DUF3613 domain-containing protein [Paraburkholderia sp. DHOC27]
MLTSLGCAAPCWAQGDAGEASAPPSEVDHATNAWLALQRSNTAAAPAQPMLGAEAGLAYQRYLTSFTSKIPESYGSMMGQGGSGGSPSGGLPQN